MAEKPQNPEKVSMRHNSCFCRWQPHEWTSEFRALLRGSDPCVSYSSRDQSMTSPTPSDPEVVNESISVLVVDDEFSLRESCASLLTTDDYQVTTVGRGDEALDLIRRKRFDILLVDLFMTQASGMEILEVATSVSPDSVVILMTGNPSVETSIEGLRAGAWDYLPKLSYETYSNREGWNGKSWMDKL